MKQTIKAAIYIRASTREQAMEGYSLDAQERLLTEYCQMRKYSVYKVYRDEGISAKDIKHRPGILNLLEDAEKEEFSIILVWKLTRFSRNLADLATTCEMLDKLGVALVSYSESFDSATPAGRMVRSMLGTVAQFEREVISENVALGLLERAKQGKRTCHNVLGYCKEGKDSFSINPVEAEKVRFIFNSYIARKSILEVTELCREEGIRGIRGKPLAPQSIYTILTRPVYAGYNIFHGELYKGMYQPIITPRQYNKVQRLLAKQGRLAGRRRGRKLYIVPEE